MKREEGLEILKKAVRNIPNFPAEGVQFKDITPLFSDYRLLRLLTTELSEEFKNRGITKVVGLESRGYFMAPILALELHAGFVPIRKKGKLPAETIDESYEKEYGIDTIQIHKDALTEDDIVLIHDDLLATGGTMMAAYNLVKKLNVKKIYINFIIELDNLNGKDKFANAGIDYSALLKFEN